MKMRESKSNGIPLDIIFEESPLVVSPKQGKTARTGPSTPAAEETRNQGEENDREQDSPRAPVEARHKTRKSKKMRSGRIKAVGFRNESSRRSAEAFKKAPPPRKKPAKVSTKRKDSKVVSNDKESFRTHKRESTLKESMEEAPPQMDKSEESPPKINEATVIVEQDKNDDASHHSNKTACSEMEQGWWATFTYFPRRLYIHGEKDETKFPIFVAHTIVNDITKTVAYMTPSSDIDASRNGESKDDKAKEEQTSPLINQSDVMALVEYVSGNNRSNKKKHDEEEKEEEAIELQKSKSFDSLQLPAIEVTEDDYFSRDA